MTPIDTPPTTKAQRTAAIHNQGCKLNQADSEDLARQFVRAGYRMVDPSESADIYVLNTCTVTHVADSKARQALRATHRRNPSAFVVATGCYAQRAPGAMAAVEGVDLVIGNNEKDRLVERVLAAHLDRPVGTTIEEGPATEPVNTKYGRTRAMVKIQEGCDQVCAYCIVPRVRGRERSVPVQDLVNQIRLRVGDGYKEVVLTGTQLGSYGFDLEDANLRCLIERILSDTNVQRLRVSSLQPQEIRTDLLHLWKDPRLCPHFHMPLQSGSDQVLRAMRRRYTSAKYAEVAELIRQELPHAAITTDVIVGFPGEDEEQFQTSLSIVETLKFASMHVFPYSPRPGTSAAHISNQVDELAKHERMAHMLKLAREQASTHRRGTAGTIRQVLWERPGFHRGTPVHWGLTDTYLKVYTGQDLPLTNRITYAHLEYEDAELMAARVI